MKLNHIHIRVHDLPGALVWLDRIWDAKPTFQNEHLASVSLDPITLIVEESDKETDTIIGFESNDCDRDFRLLMERGAIADAAPADKPWGARTAYIKGPGALKFEIEAPVK
ncbi:MAG TPA: VOC family protein [Candidatus Acidoferrales bacterium]|nr:VOC family protein [Candidatus Acidoferrales bacterium]